MAAWANPIYNAIAVNVHVGLLTPHLGMNAGEYEANGMSKYEKSEQFAGPLAIGNRKSVTSPPAPPPEFTDTCQFPTPATETILRFICTKS